MVWGILIDWALSILWAWFCTFMGKQYNFLQACISLLVCWFALQHFHQMHSNRVCKGHAWGVVAFYKNQKGKKCYNFRLHFGEKYNYKTKALTQAHNIFQRYDFQLSKLLFKIWMHCNFNSFHIHSQFFVGFCQNIPFCKGVSFLVDFAIYVISTIFH